MKRINTYFKVVLCLLCGVLLAGCKTSRKVGTVASKGAKQEAVFFTSLKEQALQYNTLTARLNVTLDLPGKNFSSRVDLKMIRDSALQLSVVPFLGIEAFRIELTADSIKVIDRLNKRYVADNYEKMRSETPVAFNFYNLQALFTDHIFIPGEKEFSTAQYSRFKLIQEGPAAEIRITDNLDILYTFIADGEEKLLSTHISDPSGRFFVNWLYSDFRLVENQPFPMQMDVSVNEEQVKKGGIQIGFSRMQLNDPLQIETSLPARYQQVRLSDIIKSLTKNL